jgi:hypothetical protein
MRRTQWKKLGLSLLLFACFYASGHVAMFLEHWHNNLAASGAVFSMSFVGLFTGALKLYTDIFA